MVGRMLCKWVVKRRYKLLWGYCWWVWAWCGSISRWFCLWFCGRCCVWNRVEVKPALLFCYFASFAMLLAQCSARAMIAKKLWPAFFEKPALIVESKCRTSRRPLLCVSCGFAIASWASAMFDFCRARMPLQSLWDTPADSIWQNLQYWQVTVLCAEVESCLLKGEWWPIAEL